MPKFNSVVCVCRRCNKEFLVNPSKIAQGRGLYCSIKCARLVTKEEREIQFWNKVQKTTKCWLWIGGSKHPFGYGIFSVNRKSRQAHRISWELTRGPIPSGMCVCHTCDVPACVNPDHLFLGTMKDNNADRSKKGRIIPRIMAAKLAAAFGVTPARIYEIASQE